MTQIKVIFWDLEGVCFENIIEPTLKLYGLKYEEPQRKAWKECIIGKISEREFFERTLKGTSHENKIDEVIQNSAKIVKVKQDGALPLIKNLQGKITQGVISNQALYWIDVTHDIPGLRNYFDSDIFIVSASQDIACDKSGTKIFEIALERAGVRGNEALFFDDKQKYVDMARKAGLNAELFINGNEAERVLKEKYNML